MSEVEAEEGGGEGPHLVETNLSVDVVYKFDVIDGTAIVESAEALPRFSFWKAKNSVSKFIGKLLTLLPECPHHHKRFSHFFDVLALFAKQGNEEALLLIRMGALPRLLDFYQVRKGLGRGILCFEYSF